MSTQDNERDVSPVEDDAVFNELDQIHDSLLDELAHDNRLESGVPDDQRGGDLDFIEMTGLASPGEPIRITEPGLSFYEPGVKDVDASIRQGDSTVGQAADETLKAPKETDLATELERLLSEELQESSSQPDMNQAEEYLNDLQAQVESREEPTTQQAPPVAPMVPPAVEELPMHAAWALPPRESDEDGDLPEALPHTETKRTRRRKQKGRSKARKYFVRAFLLLLVLCLTGIAAYITYPYVLARITTPADQLARAHVLLARGAYSEAYREYSAFARSNPDHPGRAGAQFNAAYILQLTTNGTARKQTAAYEQSLAQFIEFLRENPDHVKASRAAVMTGILNYRLGNYQDAITILRDPELRLKDPSATLAIIRTLARCYAMLGDYGQAHSSFIQAAAYEDNPTPDMDYNELGDLYQKASRTTDDLLQVRTYQEAALEQWRYVQQNPGLSPTAKRDVQSKIDALTETMRQGGESPIVDPAAADPDPLIDPAADMSTTPMVQPDSVAIVEAEPVPEQPDDAAPDPLQGDMP